MTEEDRKQPHPEDETDFSDENSETTQMDAVDDEADPGKSKSDSQETRLNEPFEEEEKEPWSVLDMARSFAGAANGSALAVSALTIFIILILATIFRFIAVVIDRSLTDYIFNGLAILTALFGLSIGSGTVSKIHAAILRNGKHTSISDAMGYMLSHALNLLLSPLNIIILTGVIAALEIGVFYLCRYIPYLYGVLFFPLILLTLILLCMTAVLAIFMNLSPPAVAAGGFKGRGAFEKTRELFRKKTLRVIAYSALVLLVVGIVCYIFFFAGKHVFNFQQTYFAGNIFEEFHTETDGTASKGRGYDYYDAAFSFLKNYRPSAETKYVMVDGTKKPLKAAELNKLKGALFLLSLYITISVFLSYVLSLYSSLNTVAYLALCEDTEEV